MSQHIDWEATLENRLLRLGLPKPARQYRFATEHDDEDPELDGREYRFDLSYPLHLLGIEVHGGSWGKGRGCPLCGGQQSGGHTTGTGFERDCLKESLAAVLGWRLIKVTPAQIESGLACLLVAEALGDPQAIKKARFVRRLLPHKQKPARAATRRASRDPLPTPATIAARRSSAYPPILPDRRVGVKE